LGICTERSYSICKVFLKINNRCVIVQLVFHWSLCYFCNFLFILFTIREEKVRTRVLRIFKIWEERDVYSNSFVDELSMLLDSPMKTETKPTVKQSSDFEVIILIL
jgi:hypothetical protein